MDENEVPITPKPRVRPELIFSLLSLFASISAVAITGAQTQIMVRQQEASVWPYLELNQTYTGEGSDFSITNKGIGPAKIKKLTYDYQGKSYTDIDPLAREIFQDKDFRFQNFSISKIDKNVLSVGERIVIFGFRVTPEDRKNKTKAMEYATKLFAATPKIKVHLEYESVYGSRWENVNNEVNLVR